MWRRVYERSGGHVEGHHFGFFKQRKTIFVACIATAISLPPLFGNGKLLTKNTGLSYSILVKNKRKEMTFVKCIATTISLPPLFGSGHLQAKNTGMGYTSASYQGRKFLCVQQAL